jgi:hypothetical protein
MTRFIIECIFCKSRFLFFFVVVSIPCNRVLNKQEYNRCRCRHSEELSPKTGRNSPWPPTQERVGADRKKWVTKKLFLFFLKLTSDLPTGLSRFLSKAIIKEDRCLS